MRVIAGEFRSRRLKSLPGAATRPTPDRMRETLLSILQPVIAGSVFVDAFAGTGAVGIEALSRGAAKAIFLERNPAAIQVIRDNLKSLDIGRERALVIAGAVSASLSKVSKDADIVFLDPPYDRELEYLNSLAYLGKHTVPLLVVQHHAKFALSETAGLLKQYRTVRQGDNVLSFFHPTP